MNSTAAGYSYVMNLTMHRTHMHGHHCVNKYLILRDK